MNQFSLSLPSLVQQRLTRLTAAYLTAPVLVFLLTWFQPLYGIPLGALLIIGCVLTFRGGTVKQALAQPSGLTRGQWLAVVAVALLWTMLGGAGHLFYANFFDWHVRDALLLDLSRNIGPLAVQAVPGNETWLLRCPLGFYLVPALFGRLAGLQFAQLALLVWTFTGVLLFLAQLALLQKDRKHLLLVLLIVPLFSGMDWVGGFLTTPQPLFSTVHIQWWAYIFQYSSNSTQLFWVPNHALPGWLFAAFIYVNWNNARQLRSIPFWLAMLPLWSPLTAVGTWPFLFVYAIKHLRQRSEVIATLKGAGWFVLPAAICAFYLVLDAGRVAEAAAKPIPLWIHIQLYTAFVIIEFAILWALLISRRRDSLLLTTGAILFVLPMLHLGPNNDLVMRASIAPLIVLCIAAVEHLASVQWRQPAIVRGIGASICVLLALGAITPLHEIARALVTPRWDSPLTATVFIETQGAPHYFAHVNSHWFAKILAPINLQQVRLNSGS